MLILHQDQKFVIVAKPPGISVHRQKRFPNEKPVLQRVRDHFEKKVWPVHRLDRQASGCLMFAFESSQVQFYSEALAQSTKSYLALVRGCFSSSELIEVNTPIKSKRGYQDAHSSVQCLGRSTEPRCSLLKVHPHTGRHHQVRRHVRDLNHPILHDGDHGDSRVNRWWRENMNLRRLGLHALRIEFHTLNLTVECPLFEDHHSVLKQLPFWSEVINLEPILQSKPIL